MDIGGDAAGWSIRSARAADADFLLDMTIEALNWRPNRRVTRRQVLETPGLAHYSRGWPRPGDLGLIALDERRQPIGAAWLRTFDVGDPGFGFVAPDVPEVTVAVVPMRRGRGVGRGLLEALLTRAAASGIRRVSISVEHGNAAASLYTSLGFVPYEQEADSRSDGAAIILVLDLDAPTWPS